MFHLPCWSPCLVTLPTLFVQTLTSAYPRRPRLPVPPSLPSEGARHGDGQGGAAEDADRGQGGRGVDQAPLHPPLVLHQQQLEGLGVTAASGRRLPAGGELAPQPGLLLLQPLQLGGHLGGEPLAQLQRQPAAGGVTVRAVTDGGQRQRAKQLLWPRAGGQMRETS